MMPGADAALALLAGAAWRAALVLAIAACGTRVLRRASAATRHRVWAGAVCGILLLAPLSLLPPLWRIPLPAGASGPRVVAVDAWVGDGVRDVPRGIQAYDDALPSPAALLVGLWAAGAMVLLARLGISVGRLWWMGARAAPVPAGRMRALADRCAREAGIARPVRFRVGSVPVTWGTWRPTVLLPADAAGWPEDRLRAVLLHELAHARRGDCAAQWAAAAVCAVHWYNPLAWHAAARMRLEAEHAADDAALARTPAADYAAHLLHVAASLHHAGTRAAAAMARPTQLRRRIEAVLDPRRARGGAAGWVTGAGSVAGAALLLLLGCVGTTSAHLPRGGAPHAAGDTTGPRGFARRFGVPLPVASAVRRAALAEGVDPELAFRLVRAESGFAETPRPGERGVGLARILPSTARWMQPGVTRAALRDRDTSLRLAFRYLRGAIRDRPGDLPGALGIYLRGPRGPTAGDAEYVRQVLGARPGAPAYRGAGVAP